MGKLRHILSTILLLAAEMNVFAAKDYFLSTTYGFDSYQEYYLCHDVKGLHITPTWRGTGDEHRVNAKWYVSPVNSSEIDETTPIQEFSNVLLGKARYNVLSSMFNVLEAKETQRRTFKIVTEDLETGVVDEDVITIVARYVPQPTEIVMPTFCEGNGMLALIGMKKYFDTDKYSWYDENGNAIKGASAVLNLSSLPAGKYTYYASAKYGRCLSEKLELTLQVNGKTNADINYPFVTYSSDEDYKNDVQQQSLKVNGGLLVDGKGCKYKWYDQDQKELSSPYKPQVPEEAGQKVYTPYVSQNCGCGWGEKTPYFVVCNKYPSPEISDVTVCFDETVESKNLILEPKIKLLNNLDSKSNYYLELSESLDFSSVIAKGNFGEELLTLAFAPDQPGEHTYYIRQVSKSGDEGTPVSFKINVAKAKDPVMKAAEVEEGVCLYDLNSYLEESESNIEWYNAEKDILSSTEIDGSLHKGKETTYYARTYYLEDAEKCYSSFVPVRVLTVDLEETVDFNENLCLNTPSSVIVKGNNPNSKTAWSKSPSWVDCTYSSDNTENTIILKEPKDFTLTASISFHSCKFDYPLSFKPAESSLSGKVKIIRDNSSLDTYEVSENVTLYSCNLDSKIVVEFPNEITSFVVKDANGNKVNVTKEGETYSFVPTTWGTYSVTYIDGCALDFEISLMKPQSSEAKLKESSAKVCRNSEETFDLNSSLDGAFEGVWFDYKDEELESGVVNVSDYRSSKNKFFFYPALYISSMEGEDSKCLGEPLTLEVLIDSIDAKISAKDKICVDDEVELSVSLKTASTTPLQYSWNTTPGNAIVSSNSNSQSFKVKGVEPKVDVTLEIRSDACKIELNHSTIVGQRTPRGNLSVYQDNQIVKVLDLEKDELNIPLCRETQVTLELDATSDFFTLYYPNNSKLNYPVDGTQKIKVSSIGNHIVKYTNGCESVVELNVYEPKKPEIVDNGIKLCPNSSTYIAVSNAENCRLTIEGDNQTYSDGRIKITSESKKGLYEKTYKAFCDGCEITPTDKLSYEVDYSDGLGDKLYAETLGNTVCEGEEVMVTRLYTVPPSRFAVLWDDNSDVSGNKTSQTVTIRPTIANWKEGEIYRTLSYAVKLTNTDKCVGEGARIELNDSVSVIVGRPFEVDVTGNTFVCEGDTAVLTVSSVDSAEKYKWFSSTDLSVLDKNDKVINIKPSAGDNVYKVTVSRIGCVASKSYVVKAGAKPEILSIDKNSKGELSVIASSNSGNPLTYSIGETENKSGEFRNLSPGKYKVNISDEDGCSMDTTIVMGAPNLLLPLYFSPNGDGENDLFSIPEDYLQYSGVTMSVYDRRGREITRLNSSNSSWDGTYNGKPMPSDDYWYVLNVDELDKVYKGHFTLIRK